MSNAGVVTCKAYKEADMQLVIDALREERGSLVLKTDLILNDVLLDEGKSLAMVGKNGVNSIAELRKELETNHPLENGKYRPRVEMAFCLMSAMDIMCQDLKGKIGARKEADDAKAEEDADPDSRLDPNERVSYKLEDRNWRPPENASADDTRIGNSRIVDGGAPQCLQVSPMPSALRHRAAAKRIGKIMTTEPDDAGLRKVYIEDQDVVDCDESCITVKFTEHSYHVRVEAPGGALEHGPEEMGEVDVTRSRWRLKRGKRLTITVAKRSAIPQKVSTTDTVTKALRVLGGVVLLFLFTLVLFLKKIH